MNLEQSPRDAMAETIGPRLSNLLEHHSEAAVWYEACAIADDLLGAGWGRTAAVAPGWIACSERMPPVNSDEWYLTWDGEFYDVDRVNWLIRRDGRQGLFFRINRPPVTHWASLPAPPTVTGPTP